MNNLRNASEIFPLSLLKDALDCIRELLGHSNLSTTLGYIYNPLTEKKIYDLISKAL